MLIEAIRAAGSVKEVINSDHVARAWEEKNRTGTDPETLTHVMFSNGLVVVYSWFMVQGLNDKKPEGEGSN